MKYATKVVLVMIMSLMLLGSATVVFAQDDSTDRANRDSFRGEVAAVGDSDLTVLTRDGVSVTVYVDGDTKIRIAGNDGGDGSLIDIEVGNFVGVHGHRNDDGSINANLIIVLPARPKDLARVHGKVTAIDGEVIVIENRDGDSQHITTNADTKFWIGKDKGSLSDIKVDDPIVAVGVRQDNGNFLAKLVVVATDKQLRQHTLRGEVLSVDTSAGTLTLEARGDKEGTWTIHTTNDTKYRIRGVDNPTLANIQVGDNVLVLGSQDEDGGNSGTARAIAVIPKRNHDGERVHGEVTAIEGTTFTLHAQRGDFTILTDDSTKYRARGDQEVGFDDIEVGGKVIVLGSLVESQDNTIQAKTVGIFKANTNSD